jgi:hypothetical protein
MKRTDPSRLGSVSLTAAASATPEAPAPAAELLHELREVEQVRADAGHPRQRGQRRPARPRVLGGGAERQRDRRR